VPSTETSSKEREYVRLAGSTFSLRIIAAAIILLFCYYAQGVVITLLLSIILAYCLDPVVELLERIRIPRSIGSLITVVVLIALITGLTYTLWTRTSQFVSNWPKYSEVLRKAVDTIEYKIAGVEPRPESSASAEEARQPASRSQGDVDLVHSLLMRGIGSLYALALEATFMPFLVFFMLAGKRQVWHGTLQLFPASRRTDVKETLEDLRDVLRDYLLGMFVVTLVVIAISSLFFWFLGLDYPILIGLVSGILNMVPYIGAVLAWLPPFVLALSKWNTIGIFVAIAGVLTVIHVFAQNFVAPQLVGRRVQLNAVAITVALLFWGWVWGGMGLILAIPVTASLRVICDHTEKYKQIGRWMSA